MSSAPGVGRVDEWTMRGWATTQQRGNSSRTASGQCRDSVGMRVYAIQNRLQQQKQRPLLLWQYKQLKWAWQRQRQRQRRRQLPSDGHWAKTMAQRKLAIFLLLPASALALFTHFCFHFCCKYFAPAQRLKTYLRRQGFGEGEGVVSRAVRCPVPWDSIAEIFNLLSQHVRSVCD